MDDMDKRALDRYLSQSDEHLHEGDNEPRGDTICLSEHLYERLVRKAAKADRRRKALQALNRAYIHKTGAYHNALQALAAELVRVKEEYAEIKWRMDGLEK